MSITQGSGKKSSIDKTKDDLIKLQVERNHVYKQLLNKNIDQWEIINLRQKKYLIEKAIRTAHDLLENSSVQELDRYYQDISSNLPTTTPATAPPTLPKPQAPKTDIQPMIINAQQIIADETAVYNKSLQKTVSEDELKVKQSSSLNAIIPLFKAIFRIKPDEVQALHSSIIDPVWKKQILDAMPEINRPNDVVPVIPKPKPDEPPIEPPPPPPDQPPEKKPIVVKDLQDRINQEINQINEVYADDVVNPRTKIAVFCNKILDILEEGRFNGLDVKGNLSLEELGGSISKKAIKDELWDDFTKGVRWDQGADVKVPTPAEFSQELVKLVNKVKGHEDDLDIIEEETGTLSESTIFNTLRPDINEVIKYLIKGRKWYNNDIRQYKEYLTNAFKPKSEIGNQTPISKAYAKLADSIYKHANEESMFDDQGETNQKEADLPPAPSGAVFNSQLKSLVNQLNGTIDSWNMDVEDEHVIKPQQTEAGFYVRVLNDVNRLVDKYHERDRYEAQGSFDRSFRNDMDNTLNSIISSKPTASWANGLKAKILQHAKDNTKFTFGGRRRGRPVGSKGGRKITKAVEHEYQIVADRTARSFKGLKMPIEGSVIVDKVLPKSHFKNPSLSRVNKYTEGSGKKLDLITKSNVDQKRQALLKSIGKGKIDIEIDTSDSESDKEKKGGAGEKKDWIDFYTDPVVKKVFKKLNSDGKKKLKEVFDKLLEKYPKEMEKYLDYTKYFLLYMMVGGNTSHIYTTGVSYEFVSSLIDKYANLKSNDDDESEITNFIIDQFKEKKLKIFDIDEGFTDIPKPKSGRRARGNGKKVGHKKKKPTFTEI